MDRMDQLHLCLGCALDDHVAIGPSNQQLFNSCTKAVLIGLAFFQAWQWSADTPPSTGMLQFTSQEIIAASTWCHPTMLVYVYIYICLRQLVKPLWSNHVHMNSQPILLCSYVIFRISSYIMLHHVTGKRYHHVKPTGFLKRLWSAVDFRLCLMNIGVQGWKKAHPSCETAWVK